MLLALAVALSTNVIVEAVVADFEGEPVLLSHLRVHDRMDNNVAALPKRLDDWLDALVKAKLARETGKQRPPQDHERMWQAMVESAGGVAGLEQELKRRRVPIALYRRYLDVTVDATYPPHTPEELLAARNAKVRLFGVPDAPLDPKELSPPAGSGTVARVEVRGLKLPAALQAHFDALLNHSLDEQALAHAVHELWKSGLVTSARVEVTGTGIVALMVITTPAPDDLRTRFAKTGQFVEPLDFGGVKAFVARKVPPADALRLLGLARKTCGNDCAAILADDGLLPRDHDQIYEPIEWPKARALADVRKARRDRLGSSSLVALRTASPQSEPYTERDAYLEAPDGLTILIAPRPLLELATCFSPGDAAEVVTLLSELRASYGAEPIYASGAFIELAVSRPPKTVSALRAAAADMYLLSPLDREGIGQEPAPRLLRRLQDFRWVVWWFNAAD